MKKNIAIACLMFSFFGFRCQKKSPPANIESWLEHHFPGEFRVVDTNLKMLDVMAQFKGEKQALVAVKSDSIAQFLLDWQKGADSLGVDPEMVKELQRFALKNASNSRKLYQLLASTALENFSVSVYRAEIVVQVFAEPTPEFRKEAFDRVVSVLKSPDSIECSSFRFEMMEPSAYGVKYQQFFRLEDYYTEPAWLKEVRIMSLQMDWEGEVPDGLFWEISTDAKRSAEYKDLAFAKAKEWAEKKLPQPLFWDDGRIMGYEIVKHGAKAGKRQKLDNQPAIRFAFPYYNNPPGENEEPDGYITGTYNYDDRQFVHIQREDTW